MACMTFGLNKPKVKRVAQATYQNMGENMKSFYQVTWSENVELTYSVIVEAESEAQAIMIVEASESSEAENKPVEERKPQRKVIR